MELYWFWLRPVRRQGRHQLFISNRRLSDPAHRQILFQKFVTDGSQVQVGFASRSQLHKRRSYLVSTIKAVVDAFHKGEILFESVEDRLHHFSVHIGTVRQLTVLLSRLVQESREIRLGGI